MRDDTLTMRCVEEQSRENLTELLLLEEPEILHQLKSRFAAGNIYVRAAQMLTPASLRPSAPPSWRVAYLSHGSLFVRLVQTHSGDVLIALNPYARIDEL